ncbi:MAG: hypothetical protein Q7U30_16420, partial [Methylicorpusculum sp.]|nr:hypothetical protein [Methylicorpusculum sp.]
IVWKGFRNKYVADSYRDYFINPLKSSTFTQQNRRTDKILTVDKAQSISFKNKTCSRNCFEFNLNQYHQSAKMP